MKMDEDNLLFMLVYVDDLIFGSNNESQIYPIWEILLSIINS